VIIVSVIGVKPYGIEKEMILFINPVKEIIVIVNVVNILQKEKDQFRK
jgi:hypothetical protein